MKIANFKEYIAVLREIYSQEAMGELGNYYHALMQSGAELKKKKAGLQKQLYFLNAEIKKQAERIRQAEDKKSAGLEMGKLQKQKQEQITLLKQLRNSDHFNVLSEEAKASVCSSFLLQKFFARELLENNPLHFPLNDNGDMVINPEKLRNSDIFQEAGHIRDFVTAYLMYYPDKVKTPGHFKTLLNGVKDWTGLMAYADHFFETMNDSDFMEEGPVKASRQGAEVIKTWPEKKLQLVRLHTEKALDYESDKMRHCVGKGGYDKGVKSGKTHIYSLRDMSDEGEWLPHATIEYEEGKIKQVKGFDDKSVGREYFSVVREAVQAITGTKNLDKLNQEGKLADLKNWGYLCDENKRLICTYEKVKEVELKNVSQNDWFLEYLEPEALKTETFVITKGMTDETFAFMRRFKEIGKLSASEIDVDDIEAARKLVKDFTGSLDLANIEHKVEPGLYNKLGYYRDTGGRLHDLLHLNEVVELESLSQTESCWKQADRCNIRLKTFVLGNSLSEAEKEEIKQLKGIDFIDNTEQSVGHWAQGRQFLKEILRVTSDQELAGRVSKPDRLGFVPSFSGHRGFAIVLSGNSQPSVMVDLLNAGKMASVGDLSLSPEQLESVDAAHLRCQKLEIKGNLTPQHLHKIAEFAKYQDIYFDETDFGKSESLDFSGLTHWGEPMVIGDVRLMSVYSFFLDGYTVSRFLPGSDIVMHDCKNLPPIENIKFPANIQNIMIEPVPGEGYPCRKLDFSGYPQLDALQLNNLTMVENAEIKLPENLTYLAFYNCDLSVLRKMDLSGLNKLTELRMTECNLSGLEQYAFPRSLQKTALGGSYFKPGVDLDLSACESMKRFNLSSWHKVPFSSGSIRFPSGIEDINLSGLEFPELKELDFSIYPHLRRLSLDQSSFPKLEKLVLPTPCDCKTGNMKTDAEITVMGRRQSSLPEKNLDNAVLLRFKGLKVVDAR